MNGKIEEIKVSVKGVSPLILNNGQTADPLNAYTKRLKEFQSKRKKTDDDYENISRIEWESALYLDENNMPVIPSDCIEAMLRESAGKSRVVTKKDLQASVWVAEDAKLITNAPFPNLDKAYEECCFRKLVRVNTARVVRTRPIFFNWKLNYTITYLPDMINRNDLENILNVASYRIGMGDWRPKFGRFEILEIS